MSLPDIARRRQLLDRAVSIAIGGAGIAVLALLLLLLWYLLRVALPLAEPFRMEGPEIQELSGPVTAREVSGPQTDPTEVIGTRAPDGRRWRLRRDGSYRCQTEQSWRDLRGLRAEPRLMDFAELGETLLVIDANGLLYRFAAPHGVDCRLESLGEPRQQPFLPRTLLAEQHRPVIYLLSGDGRLRVMHSVSGALLFDGPLPDAQGAGEFQVNADGTLLMARRGAQSLHWRIDNRFAESGWRSLWLPQRFSGYDGEVQVWQPDGESVGALSKYALTPLLFGTFKAALSRDAGGGSPGTGCRRVHRVLPVAAAAQSR